MSSLLHRHTPAVSANDPRGIGVRTAQYYRSASGTPPRTLLQGASFDAAGRQTMSWDARSVKLLATRHSLSGIPLASLSADAGLLITLYGGAAEPVTSWNANGWQQRIDYDRQLRPIASFEASAEQDERCLERLSYGGPEAHVDNGCGALLRHDDASGCHTAHAFSVVGLVMRQGRRFLKAVDEPNWPEAPESRDELLEADVYFTQWNHDAVGSALVRRDTRGNELTFRYAMDGALSEQRLRLASGEEHTLAAQITYGAMGELSSQATGKKLTSEADYDPATGRLRSLRARRADGELLQHLDYDYDPAGNVVAVTDRLASTAYSRGRRTDGERTFRYDTLYQLVEAHGLEGATQAPGPGLPPYGDASQLTPYVQIYEYDDSGNLTALRQQGEHPFTQRMIVASDSNRSVTWLDGMPEPEPASAFDAGGNQLALQNGGRLRWNGRNQLAGVTTITRTEVASDEERYRYGADGMRCQKTGVHMAGGIQHTREIRYLPGIELRSDTQANEELDVISAPAGLCGVTVLCWRSSPPEGISDGQIRFQIGDQLGSVTVELDADARLISAEGYYPFGMTAWRSAKDAREADYRAVRYSGKERDTTGLYYYGFRFYAPWQCRWIQTDPAGDVDGQNRYRFVRNSPVGRSDRDGLISDDGVLLAVVTATILSLALAYFLGAYLNRGTAAPNRTKLLKKVREVRKRDALEWMKKNFANIRVTPEHSENLRSFLVAQSYAGRTNFVRTKIDKNFEIHTVAMTSDELEGLARGLGDADDITAFADEHGLPIVSVALGNRRDSLTSGTSFDSRRGSVSSVGTWDSVYSGAIAGPSNVRKNPNKAKRGSTSSQPTSSATTTPSPPPTPEQAEVPITYSARFEAQFERMRRENLRRELRRVEFLLTHLREGGTPVETVRVNGIDDLTGSDRVPGFGHTGAGAYRLLTTGNRTGRTIEGIANPHHRSGTGYGEPRWW